MDFPFDRIRRAPDIEGPGLVAVDAADRLILDESAAARANATSIVVIGDAYGGLALASAAGSSGMIRVHQDGINAQRALARNAAELGLTDRVVSLPLAEELVTSADLVLVRLPRSLDALRDIARLIAAFATPGVAVYAGGRIKHMTPAMNDVLRESFDTVDVTHARQKSRVLIAHGPHGGAAPEPVCVASEGMTLCALGGVFAGARLDIGTRFLLDQLPADLAGGTADDPWIDLACGNGSVGVWLTLRHPAAHIYGSDQSAAAVTSARATAVANGVSDRVSYAQEDALEARADASASVIILNPPFHSGAALSAGIAHHLFADAARVLHPGGELWCVWNSPLGYRGDLERTVGATRQVARNAKFTVTVSTRR